MVGVSVSGAEGGGGELLVKEKKMLGSSVLSVSLSPESVCCRMLAAKSGDSRPAPESQCFLLAAHTQPTQRPCDRIQLGKQERYHFIPTRMAKVKKIGNTSVGKDVQNFEPSYIAGRNAKWCGHYGIQFGSSSKG